MTEPGQNRCDGCSADIGANQGGLCDECAWDLGQEVEDPRDYDVLAIEYRSPEWYEVRRQGISASEIASVLGIQPSDWTSKFDLWWLKRTGEDSNPENDEMRRGRRLEGLILEDFTEAHPELTIEPGVMVRNRDRPWQMATLDGQALDGSLLVAPVECKSAFSRSEWGEPGTDDIPVYYKAQVLWQMDTLGVDLGFVAVWFGTQYAEYVIERDDTDIKAMRQAAQEFLASLAADRSPDLDDSLATLRRVKHLHPSIEPGEVEVPAATVAQYRAAKRLRDAAEARMRLAESRIRSALGNHDTAVVDGLKVAGRYVYDVHERTQTVRAHTVNKLTFTRERNAS